MHPEPLLATYGETPVTCDCSLARVQEWTWPQGLCTPVELSNETVAVVKVTLELRIWPLQIPYPKSMEPTLLVDSRC